MTWSPSVRTQFNDISLPFKLVKPAATECDSSGCSPDRSPGCSLFKKTAEQSPSEILEFCVTMMLIDSQSRGGSTPLESKNPKVSVKMIFSVRTAGTHCIKAFAGSDRYMTAASFISLCSMCAYRTSCRFERSLAICPLDAESG